MRSQSDARVAPKMSSVLAYTGMVAIAVVLFFIIRWQGSTLVAPTPTAPMKMTERAASENSVATVLVGLAAVLICAKVAGWLLARMGQPPVIGELLGGILLGSSILGRLAPGISMHLLPVSVAPHLAVIAQIGIIVYMCRIGLELNGDVIRHHAYATIAISHASILVPFTLGAGLALLLYPLFSTANVSFGNFALFIGLSMSVTAFPVLARILVDRGIGTTPLGTVALTCAAVADVTAWCLLALVAGVVQAHLAQALMVFVFTATFVTALVLSRPVIRRVLFSLDHQPAIDYGVAIAFAVILFSAFLMEKIGMHAIFGAFLLGAVIPNESVFARALERQLEAIAGILLPVYFAFTGMRMQIGSFPTLSEWLACALVLAVAIAGKLGGTATAARFCGMGWQSALSLGVLMNTRGLMELIVLNLGLDMKIISSNLFAIMVLMTVVTTLMTGPALTFVGDRVFKSASTDVLCFAKTLKPEQVRQRRHAESEPNTTEASG